MSEEECAPPEPDMRAEFVAEYCCRCFRLNALKMITEEFKETLLKFFDRKEYSVIVVTMVPGAAAPSIEFDWPMKLKGKGLFFMKKVPKSVIPKDDFKLHIRYGELSINLLAQLSCVTETLYLPMISNSSNHSRWPKVVSRDLIEHTHKMKNRVYVISGLTRDQTFLPEPLGLDELKHDHIDFNHLTEADRAMIHRIETIVIDWSHQLFHVISKDSSEPLVEEKNPTPYVEIKFWTKKAENLQFIYEQISTPRMKEMAEVLKSHNSTYYLSLSSIYNDLMSGIEQAKDISAHLRPLKYRLDSLQQEDFSDVIPQVNATMHCIGMIWANSDHYRTPGRIIVLLQEMCNLIISMCRNYLDPFEVFKGEIEETTHKMNKAMCNLNYFRRLYKQYATSKLAPLFKEGKEPVFWTFPDDLVFTKFDAFVRRVSTVKEVIDLAVEFYKLEKVELSGIHGKVLSLQMNGLYEAFQEHFKIFSENNYDNLDPENLRFNHDLVRFEERMKDMDCKLGSIVCQGFDDLQNVEAIFKMFDCFGSVLDRRMIQLDLQSRLPKTIEMFADELDRTKLVFDAQMRIKVRAPDGYVPVHRNMPSVSGQIKWAREMKDKLFRSYMLFKHPDRDEWRTDIVKFMEKETGKEMQIKYHEMVDLLDKYEADVFTKWTRNVTEKTDFNLGQPLLKRIEPDNKLISINFDPHSGVGYMNELIAVLREVKYLIILGRETEIPNKAKEMFQNVDMYLKYSQNLDLVVSSYNKIVNSCTPTLSALVRDEIGNIDSTLREAETTLNWNSPSVWNYIDATRDTINDLWSRLQNVLSNLDKISELADGWQVPLFERKEGKAENLIDLDNRTERVSKRYDTIRKGGETIHQLMKENQTLLRADASSAEWKAYLTEVDQLLAVKFKDCIDVSYVFFLNNTDPSKNTNPLFEVKLEFRDLQSRFQPLLKKPCAPIEDKTGQKSARTRSIMTPIPPPAVAEPIFTDMIRDLVDDILNISTLVPRIDCSFQELPTEEQAGYRDLMRNFLDSEQHRSDFLSRVPLACDKAMKFKVSLERYSYLWNDDRSEFMKSFLTYGRVISAEELETVGLENLEEQAPTLEQFKQQIDLFESLHAEIDSLENSAVFDSWLRVDARPFKHALLNICGKWGYMFKEHLVKYVTNSLSELANTIREANNGLVKDIQDYAALVECMAHLGRIKERQASTDQMFEPIKSTIDLLKSYHVEVNDDVYLQLQELPEQWDNTKKVAVAVKQNVAPMQADEVARIRKRCSQFETEQLEFKDKSFKAQAPFKYNTSDPYSQLDQQNENVTKLEEVLADITNSADLFEVTVPEFKHLKQCRKEVKMLKTLWDLIFLIRSTFESWTTSKWTAIDVTAMDQECGRFSQNIRGLDKEMKTWDCYVGIEKEVKNLITSLRSVAELRSPSIRDRHWNELMGATGVKIMMSDDTKLADLLALNLHNYEDEVKNIVDKAEKEGGMEKVLRDLDVTWASMEVRYEDHPRTGVPQLRADEELIELLEDNQVQLQNMMSSRFIAHFLEEVSAWQKKLSTADAVIQIWLEVQRNWSHLESIFIGSEDIRRQLPDDAARFDQIDSDFKELMEEAKQTPNVINATNKEGWFERLEKLQDQLSLCEKALAEYLETKRLAFPRFYFVSSADLLDILSNGNSPPTVCRHLSKLFDSLAWLDFKEGETNVAVRMSAKDGEIVDLDKPCECEGQVEQWLNSVELRMQESVRAKITEAVIAYEEKSREVWIFDWPAQPALTTTQIWWTTEVGIAFGRLEEGYENALKDYNKKQIGQLRALIELLISNLSKGDRQKIMTICTIDVHARDVVQKLIVNKIDSAQAFTWLSQLRHRYDDEEKHCFANICDAQFRYWYEYLGNTPRLVITPLTDRCYITLTQSLHLNMGGGPAGPAGTGKTETTKDLGRALGIMVYVFNCSEQMDYKSCGNIYKGLAQTGAWGCFDEFNRISVEVLSVVAVQVKSVLDAVKDKRSSFNFMSEEISLKRSVGMFITMNPGYAGRTELPENLKALFRPCAMVVPDFALIAEIMLVAEAFTEAKVLAQKFITLYELCKELLSKQDHYDWGLRAIKSVLVVAGSLRRTDPGLPEDQVLMRALRDFNIPKIVSDDLYIFLGLITDLFPSMNVPRKRNEAFEAIVKKTALDLSLQPEEAFIMKVVQLQELIDVRHSVFVLGNAGTGKSQVLKTLFNTYKAEKKKPTWCDLNPKAVSNDELFGFVVQATREWRDGLFSVLMRDMANMSGDSPKWIVLDGDIDPMWIESLNTVMDDNKVLTLASNERIPLSPSMRLIFEISHLKTATPATVSRAGILYLNATDIGWSPMVQSWIDSREIQSERANLTILFDKYVPPCLEVLKTRFKKITPITDTSHIQMLCYLLECLLTPKTTPPDCPKELYELYFAFACVWAFGAQMFQDQMVDYRIEFTKWWNTEFKSIKFPSSGTVFDYFIDNDSYRKIVDGVSSQQAAAGAEKEGGKKDDKLPKFEPWTKKIPAFQMPIDTPLQAVLVNTAETVRVRYFMDMLMTKGRPVMLVGSSGCGKTVMMNNKLENLNSDDYVIANVPFNFYTTSEMLQTILEKPLEKKAGKSYGPPGNKKLIYFIDDMNMPEVDKYFTVQPHTLLRQHLDYGHWYDRAKLSQKEIRKVQYVSCMNPTAGSFTINPRLQRHFSVFAISFPTQEALTTIYSSILTHHLQTQQALPNVVKLAPIVIQSTLNLHTRVCSCFLPTAVKFHYVFNLRDLSNIFQGILFATKESMRSSQEMVRLWMHECRRVYKDKLVDTKDLNTYERVENEILNKAFEKGGENQDNLPRDLNLEELKVTPLIYSHFAQGLGESHYVRIESWEALNKILTEALFNYNEVNAVMSLVLFEDAMQHVCRINRILESPRGNALLIGVGGSGKQSLARLAASISGLEVFQIQLKKGYGVAELKVDLNQLYMKTGVRNAATVFLMTDAHVADEKFLVLINDLLASGEIPDIFSEDEIEEIVNAIRPEVKQVGILDTKENCWKFFIEKVRKLLKVVLCFSPVGKLLRVRARRFPAVVNCTCIDWFHEWPQEALVSVSSRFLQEVDLLNSELTESVSSFMAYVHTSVNNMSQVYLENEKRYNYTTPKSFLELIKLYRSLLEMKHKELVGKMERLENGLLKLQSTASQVDALKEKLAVQEIQLAQKNDDADKLILKVGAESEKVAKEKSIADDEGRKVAAINDEVSAKQAACEKDLKRAEPALTAAETALNILDKTNLTELKSFGSPPAAVTNVTAAVMVLLIGGQTGKVPKDRSWKAAKSMMAKVDEFLNNLKNYDKDHIHENAIKAMQDYMNNEEFNPDIIGKKSFAAAGLCSWAINIVKYYEVFCDVLPKRLALEDANRELNNAKEKLSGIQAKIAGLEAQLNGLLAELQAATDEKTACQEEKDRTNLTIELANRLVGGLSSEKHRWTDSIALFRELEKQLPGDVLLISAFVSYAGAFDKKYRVDLEQNIWIPYVSQLEVPIPITEGLDPLTMLTDNAQIAQWQNEGLPSDRMSTENATILTNCERWPLMIDPQLQGIKWIKRKYGEKIQIIRLDQKGYMEKLERALAAGDTVLIENLEEELDPVLEPVLGRNTIKKGRAIKLGDKEIEYNANFKLILHTKLANPHYKPEMQAQTTLINFTVTKAGLEDQLLAAVVSKERPDLEQTRSDLTKQNNEYTITLKELEDNLLARLSAAGGNFLGDTALVENLEHTKKTAAEIEEKVAEAKITEVMINAAREDYRHAAARASLLYFILNDLYKINPIYQFSLKAFSVVFDMAIERAAPATNTNPEEAIKERVKNLIDQITYQVILYTSRGLFEKDKFIFKVQVAFQVLLHSGEIQKEELDFLLKFPTTLDFRSPVDFLNDASWGAIKSLAEMDEFKNLDRDIEGSAKRWKKFVESEYIELEKFPQEWKSKTALQRLCMLRALRPDRMIYAIELFIEEKLGAKYKENRRIPFADSFSETGPNIPVFFILSPGVDPLLEVESLGKKLGFTQENAKFHNISLGQGQDVVASAALDIAAREGHWVVLQNIHLVAGWLGALEKKLNEISESGLAHSDYRVFMSAEPAASPTAHIIPQGVLENSIKITNEPPTKISANLHKALDNFSQDTMEMCSKEAEFKSILFSLCYFHAVVAERRKFGPQGWNRVYPFNTGDLTISAMVLYNYLEANNKVPWEDLRYLFGEIMYGGHITDDWDRRLCRTYLEEYMGPDQLDGELYLAPQFPVPGNTDYKGYHLYIDETLPQESPALYGLHLNAEIGFLTTLSESLFRVVHDLQPRDAAGANQSGSTREEVVEQTVEDLMDKLPDAFNMMELHQKEETKTPYTVVCLQECERMNSLTQEIRRSLTELQLGLKGELTITGAMDDLSTALFLDKVPQTWLRYPTTFTLGMWFSDLMQRVKELETWTTDFGLPNSVWLGGLFNPQAFLTAIMQQTARKNEWPLDKMVLNCDVTKKNRDDFGAPPREGSYINGLYMEGARWDVQSGCMAEARLKELTPQMPVVYLKAILVDKLETKGTYCCPVYKTKVRGPTYVWKFHLKTKEKSAKWILGGVAILLST